MILMFIVTKATGGLGLTKVADYNEAEKLKPTVKRVHRNLQV